MKTLLGLALIFASPLCAEEPNASTLTLVNDVTFNQMSITLSVPLFGDDTQTSTLTGDIRATTDISPVTALSNQLTFSPGNTGASPVSFSLGNFVTGYTSLDFNNLGLAIATPLSPGTINPSNGIFDAGQHSFTINQGTIKGIIPGGSIPVDVDFADIPVTGTGSGNGTLTLSENGTTTTRITYTLTITMPVTATQQIPTGVFIGDTEINATLTVNATLKATSTVFVHLSAYLRWSEQNNVPGDDFNSTSINQIPNGLLWALGYDLNNLPNNLITPSGSHFTIPLPENGTLHPAVIEYSSNMTDWIPIENTQVSTGNSTIPTGSTDTITITPDGVLGFFRIRASQ